MTFNEWSHTILYSFIQEISFIKLLWLVQSCFLRIFWIGSGFSIIENIEFATFEVFLDSTGEKPVTLTQSCFQLQNILLQ